MGRKITKSSEIQYRIKEEKYLKLGSRFFIQVRLKNDPKWFYLDDLVAYYDSLEKARNKIKILRGEEEVPEIKYHHE